MAIAVFTNAEIDFVSAIGGGGAWNTVAAAWTGMNGDSSATSDAGVVSPLLLITGTLHDDASIPASVFIASIDVTFDYAVTNVGGAGGSLTAIFDRSATVGRDTAAQSVGTSSGTLTNTYYPSSYSGISTPTRADLFAMVFGFRFDISDLTTTSSRIVITNYTVTVVYQNVGVGSWMVRIGTMTNPTGATDATGLPDVVSVTGALAVGGIDLPVGDVAGAFIYVDGSGTPVNVAGLPAGFAPEDAYAFIHSTIILSLTGQTRYVHSTLFDFTVTGANLPQLGSSPPQGIGGNHDLAGMDITVLGGLIGDTITATMTDSAAANGIFVQNAAAFAIDTDAYFVGTYVSATIVSLTPDEGTVLGGTLVTGIGTNLQGVTAVKFAGVSATDVAANADGNTVTCRTPAHVAGLVSVEFVGVGTLVNTYTYINIISIKPNKGTVNGGTLVTIKGGGFSVATGVLFDGIDAPIQSQSDTVITVLTPAHPVGLVDVEVVGVATETDAYTYVPAIGPITVPPMPVLSPATQKGQP